VKHGGIAIPPAVLIGIFVERQNQTGLDQRAHAGASLVDSGHVRPAFVGQRQRQGRQQVVKQIGGALYVHAGVRCFELGGQFLTHCVFHVARPHVPDGEYRRVLRRCGGHAQYHD
jgi:hypothetical protein